MKMALAFEAQGFRQPVSAKIIQTILGEPAAHFATV